ncbi:hypothetical protein LTR62_006402 [Meristemomyces frigidus]|uniref:Polyamine transport protein n=1 Tax=Meristemomyces frigidus TaxID=1508187 RepID=A0AAN7TCI2_9PEZI|nr:hypothetical protein LTR62_006402 [Meristemomyces frigidus]
MVVTAASIAGQVVNSLLNGERQMTDETESPPRKPSSTSSVLRPSDVGHMQRTTTLQGPPGDSTITRKKLPWLQWVAPLHSIGIPGSFNESKSSLERPPPSPFHRPSHPPPPPPPEEQRASIKSIGNDLSLLPVGSDPILGDRVMTREKRRVLSLSTEPGGSPGRPDTMYPDKRHFSTLATKSARLDDYTTSEYSTTASSRMEHLPPALPPDMLPHTLQKKHASSYERLGHRSYAEKLSQRPRQSIGLAVPAEWSIPPAEYAQNADVSPLDRVAQKVERRQASSCESCGHDVPITPEIRRGTPALKPAPPAKRTATVPKPRVRKQTLFEMPTHLVASSSSNSPDSHIPPNLRVTSSQEMSSLDGPRTDIVVHAAPQRQFTQVSPKATIKQPAAPAAVHWRGLRRENRSLTRAITGMENLMEDALQVARDAAQDGRTEDMTYVLDSATTALKKANAAVPRGILSRIAPNDVPLQLSAHESGASSSSTDPEADPGTNDSLAHTRDHSADTAPTIFTKSAHSSAQPVVNSQYTKRGKAPISHRASYQHASFDTSEADDRSLTRTPPRLYQPASVDSIVRDFAYNKQSNPKAVAAKSLSALPRVRGDLKAVPKSKSITNAATAYGGHGAASDFYGDAGESIVSQPGVRQSIVVPDMQTVVEQAPLGFDRALKLEKNKARKLSRGELQVLEHASTDNEPLHNVGPHDEQAGTPPRRAKKAKHAPHIADIFTPGSYHNPDTDGNGKPRKLSSVTDHRSVPSLPPTTTRRSTNNKRTNNVLPFQVNVNEEEAKEQPRKHISLNEGQGFSLGRYNRRAPIAREWNNTRKRLAAAVACLNTIFVGLIAGIYAGEVPRIQYQIQDMNHRVILGNVLLFLGLGLTTLIFWPLPLLHGRKPYTLMAMTLMLPLQFPQALAVSSVRDPNNPVFRLGLLIPRVATGLAMGFANINQLPTLFDLFGCSLMSEAPHQEIVVTDDVRRQGGGVGIWLGIWSFCFVGSLSIGFCIGACIISSLDPSWGFYIVVILLALSLVINVITPETRRAPYRRSIAHFFDETEPEKLRRRVARGEVKLHISNDGPKWWWQEVWAGVILTTRMVRQPGFFVLMFYIAWIYAQVTLVILLLGTLLSRDYAWQPQYVGLASLSLAIGALLAVPLAKASVLSRSRFTPQRTDSMTMRGPRLTWSSHLIRRCIFTLLLPFAALAYTLSAPGPTLHWSSPTIFCGLVGFLSNLAIAECVGLIMEVFDTCDLQPGVNTKHRLQSMAESTRRRRTNYSSFPRVCAGFFAAQSLGFFLAAISTAVSGIVTRALGAQEAVACVAGILLVITVLFMAVMYRYREEQVIPTSVFTRATTKKGSLAWGPGAEDPEWQPVIIGNPSGKMRRVNLLELGDLSRWTEIRRLNKLVRH